MRVSSVRCLRKLAHTSKLELRGGFLINRVRAQQVRSSGSVRQDPQFIGSLCGDLCSHRYMDALMRYL